MGGFPATRSSVLASMRSADREVRRQAFGVLVGAYWKPVYKYLRLRWSSAPEDAQDLTQDFFTQALDKGFFAGYDPARGRFRTYLRVCLDRFVANDRRDARRQKRGGGVETVGLAFEDAEGELRHHEPLVESNLDAYFHDEWVRHVFTLAVTAFEADCSAAGKQDQFALFKRYDIEGREAGEQPTYAVLAERSGIRLTQVTNHLAWARRAFRQRVLATLREATASEEEFQEAVRDLLGSRAQ